MIDRALLLRPAASLFHIGRLDAPGSGAARRSYEGACLSVSTTPLAWRAIARLGGLPLWRAEHPGPLFLDMLAVRTHALADTIEAWASSKGLVERQTRWQAWQFDDEAEEWLAFLCDTEADAWNEVGEVGHAEAGPAGAAVTPTSVLVGTPRLAERMRVSSLAGEDAFDYAAIAWAEDEAEAIEGVWWAERYAPHALSAPRGGILPSRLARWTFREASWDDADDFDDGMRRVDSMANDARTARPRRT